MNREGDVTKALLKAGFELVRNKRHEVWRCPCGHAKIVTTSSRIGGRGDRNCYARIKKALAQCEKTEEKAA